MAFAIRVVPSRRAAARTATMLGLPGEDALDLPIVLIGTPDDLCERLLERRERWGFTNIACPARRWSLSRRWSPGSRAPVNRGRKEGGSMGRFRGGGSMCWWRELFERESRTCSNGEKA